MNNTSKISKLAPGDFIPTRLAKYVHELPAHDCFVAATVRSLVINMNEFDNNALESNFDVRLMTGYYKKDENTFYLRDELEDNHLPFKAGVYSLIDTEEGFYWLGNVDQWLEIDELSATGKTEQEYEL